MVGGSTLVGYTGVKSVEEGEAIEDIEKAG